MPRVADYRSWRFSLISRLPATFEYISRVEGVARSRTPAAVFCRGGGRVDVSRSDHPRYAPKIPREFSSSSSSSTVSLFLLLFFFLPPFLFSYLRRVQEKIMIYLFRISFKRCLRRGFRKCLTSSRRVEILNIVPKTVTFWKNLSF